MKKVSVVVCALFVLCSLLAQAQQTISTATDAVVPPLVNFGSVLADLDNKPMTGVTGVTFLLYKDQQGGSPLWMETQNVQPDESGHYSVMLGSTTSTGLPASLFATGSAHWLAVRVEGQPEQPRVLLVSAPYALKAADAETVGGLPASAFVLASPALKSGTGSIATTARVAGTQANAAAAVTPSNVTGTGTTNYIPKWTSSTAIGNSAMFQTGSGSTTKIGINTTTPADMLDVRGQGRFLVSTTLNALVGNQNGTGTAGNGVVGLTSSANGYGVYGFNNSTTTASSALPIGVYGTAASTTKGVGVYGSGAVGVEGFSTFCCNYAAIFTGYSAPTNSGNGGGPGVLIFGGAGDINAIGTTGGTGLVVIGGAATNNFSSSIGGNGIDSTGGLGTQYDGDGVGGVFTGGDQAIIGGDGVDAYGGSGSGVIAFAGNGSTPNGFYGPDGIDAYSNPSSDGISYAGYFTGDVVVTGAISAGTKDFKIDHPQDPANKYLVHASIESSEMVNIYSGNTTTDANGNATVSLPKWFESLNADFRYQLTPIGQFAQAIVAREIIQNQFMIQTDKPNVKVSWQVTGVRQDAYAKSHPLVVEQPKEAGLHGYYLHPELFGAPAEKGMAWGRQPLTMKRMQAHRAKARSRVKALPPAQTVAQAK
jgi:hypothetical protein